VIEAFPGELRREVIDRVDDWPDVVTGSFPFSPVGLTLHGHEFGHVHVDRGCHVLLPSVLATALVATGRADPHPSADDGWVSVPLETDADVERVVWCLRLAYLSLLRRERLDDESSLLDEGIDVALELDLLAPEPAVRRAFGSSPGD
jgi:hypothetical protein